MYIRHFKPWDRIRESCPEDRRYCDRLDELKPDFSVRGVWLRFYHNGRLVKTVTDTELGIGPGAERPEKGKAASGMAGCVMYAYLSGLKELTIRYGHIDAMLFVNGVDLPVDRKGHIVNAGTIPEMKELPELGDIHTRRAPEWTHRAVVKDDRIFYVSENFRYAYVYRPRILLVEDGRNLWCKPDYDRIGIRAVPWEDSTEVPPSVGILEFPKDSEFCSRFASEWEATGSGKVPGGLPENNDGMKIGQVRRTHMEKYVKPDGTFVGWDSPEFDFTGDPFPRFELKDSPAPAEFPEEFMEVLTYNQNLLRAYLRRQRDMDEILHGTRDWTSRHYDKRNLEKVLSKDPWTLKSGREVAELVRAAETGSGNSRPD